MTISGDKIIMYAGHVIGCKGTALEKDKSKEFVEHMGLIAQVLDPSIFLRGSRY